MNRSKDLRSLFRKSLINERKNINRSTSGYRGTSPMYMGSSVHRIPGQNTQFGNEIKIFFYEWSDITRAPRSFYQLEAFENFLKSSGVYMELYQREIIINLGCVYATCYTGTKSLNIRGSYKNLMDSMNEYDRKRLIPNIAKSEIRKPMVVVEPQNRWPENDGTFFG